MSKRILSLVLALVMVLGTFGTVFADTAVTEAATNGEKIDWLVEQGMVKGDASGDLMLDKLIDRASTARMITVALDLEAEAVALQTVNSGFKDMTTAHWANGYANLSAGKNLIVGDQNGNFMPAKDITYGEVAAILVRLVLGRDLTAAERGTAGSWVAPYVAKASELGVLEDLAIVDYNAKANRKDVLEMFYNAMINMEVGNYSIVKAIVLENNRVEAIGSDEVVVEVIKHVQVANWLGEVDKKDRGDQERYTIDAKVADVENLLGKVVDFTLAKGNKVVKANVDTSFDYVQGSIEATKNKLEFTNKDGKTYTVELDERYKDSDERIFRTYHNDKAYSYVDFYQDVTTTSREDKFIADFAKATIKNGKVLFIDSFTFEDVAPVKEVKREGTEVYVYNDLRDGDLKRFNFSSTTKVLSVDEKVFSRTNIEKISELDVIHVYGNNKVLVRKDTKIDGKYTKTIENKDGNFVVIEDKEYEILDKDSKKAVYAYDSKEFYTLDPKDADRVLREFKDQKVTALLDVNNNVQYLGSEIELGEYVAGVNSIVGKEVRVVKNDNTKADLTATLDTVIKLEGSTSHKNLNELNKQDIVYVSTDDKNIDKIYRLASEKEVNRDTEMVAKDKDGDYLVTRNFITMADSTKNQEYKVLDRTNVFYYDGTNIVGTTIDKIVKEQKVKDELKAYVISDAKYDSIVGRAKRATTGLDNVANTIVFTKVSFKADNVKQKVEVLEIHASGSNYEIQYRDVDGEKVYRNVEKDSDAYDYISVRGINEARKVLVGAVVEVTMNNNDKKEVTVIDSLIAPNKDVYEVVSVRSNSGYRYVTLKDRTNATKEFWISRDVAEFGVYGTARTKIAISEDKYGEIDAIVVRPNNSNLGLFTGSVDTRDKVSYINAAGTRFEVDGVVYVINEDTRLVNAKGQTLEIGIAAIKGKLVVGDKVTVKDNVITLLGNTEGPVDPVDPDAKTVEGKVEEDMNGKTLVIKDMDSSKVTKVTLNGRVLDKTIYEYGFEGTNLRIVTNETISEVIVTIDNVPHTVIVK